MIPIFNEWDKEKLRELSSRAGKASGAARRKKRQMMDEAKMATQVYKEMQEEHKKNTKDELKILSECVSILAEAKKVEDYAYSTIRGGNGLKNADIVRYYEQILKDNGIKDSRSLKISGID